MSRRQLLDGRRPGAPEMPVTIDTPPAAPAETAPAARPRARILIFAALCGLCLLVAGGYVVLAAARSRSSAERAASQPTAAAEAVTRVSSQPHLLFLQTDGDVYRRVALVPLDQPDAPPVLTSLQCQRVYAAAGRGLCVGQDAYRGGALIFDDAFQVVATLPVNGIPSRARVSPDGRLGSMTVFVQGHSYAEGGFSTRTTLVDMTAGTAIADLEDFTVTRDGARFQAADFNFWGVTFARDANRFYATLASGGKTYLIEGDIAARQARVLRDNVECPSLSPDNTRLVFKKRMEGGGRRVVWQLHMLDLATMTETPLAETRSVDDQAEWLDNGRVAYSLPDEGPPATIRPDVWSVAVDGSSPPTRLAIRAFSPAAVR